MPATNILPFYDANSIIPSDTDHTAKHHVWVSAGEAAYDMLDTLRANMTDSTDGLHEDAPSTKRAGCVVAPGMGVNRGQAGDGNQHLPVVPPVHPLYQAHDHPGERSGRWQRSCLGSLTNQGQ